MRVGLFEQTRRAWRALTSMRTALLLLFLLAVAAVPGSLLPQWPVNAPAVRAWIADHPSAGPWLDRLGMFDVFASIWFVGLYAALALSLIGCVGPRLRLHAQAMRARPPAPPRGLHRLPYADSWTTDDTPDAVAAAAAHRLSRWRVDRHTLSDGAVAIAAERGFARESGNLLFHGALLALLAAVAYGSLVGFTGRRLVVEGEGFANTIAAYDDVKLGRLTEPADLDDFTVTLADFRASWREDGQPSSFEADVRVATGDDEAQQRRLQVNHPVSVAGARVYLLDHGYAPVLTVRNRAGEIVHRQATPFLPRPSGNLLSTGVVKVPNAGPVQLGFQAVFYPTIGVTPDGQAFSQFPDDDLPGLSYIAWAGDLGVDAGTPQSVFVLDTTKMVRTGQGFLLPGQSATGLAGGATMTFERVAEYAVLQVARDPGQRPALIAATAALAGLLLSLRVRRRRIWVRASPAPGGTVVEVGGLARQDPEGFAPEFAELVAGLRGVIVERAAGERVPIPEESPK